MMVLLSCATPRLKLVSFCAQASWLHHQEKPANMDLSYRSTVEG